MVFKLHCTEIKTKYYVDRLKLSIEYETSSKAAALQWLTPEQTLGIFIIH